MKKKRYLIITLLLITLLALAGCGKEEPAKEKDTKKETEVKTNDEEDEEELLEAIVWVEYFEEGENADSDDCIIYTDPQYEDSDYLVDLLISTDEVIEDVKLIDVEMGDATGPVTGFFENAVVLELDELYPDEPLIYRTEFPNFMPNLVLQYFDPATGEQTYSICMSGEDGSLIVDQAYIQDDPSPSDPWPAYVGAQYYYDELLDPYDEYVAYYDEYYGDPDYVTPVFITTDSYIDDFRISEIEYDFDYDSGDVFYETEVIVQDEDFGPFTPMIYYLEFIGEVPNRAIIYTDTTGEEVAYALTLSGMDGSVVLSPIIIE